MTDSAGAAAAPASLNSRLEIIRTSMSNPQINDTFPSRLCQYKIQIDLNHVRPLRCQDSY